MIMVYKKTREALDEFLNKADEYIESLQNVKSHRWTPDKKEVNDEEWENAVKQHRENLKVHRRTAYVRQCCEVLKYMVMHGAQTHGEDIFGKEFKKTLFLEMMEVLDHECGIEAECHIVGVS